VLIEFNLLPLCAIRPICVRMSSRAHPRHHERAPVLSRPFLTYSRSPSILPWKMMLFAERGGCADVCECVTHQPGYPYLCVCRERVHRAGDDRPCHECNFNNTHTHKQSSRAQDDYLLCPSVYSYILCLRTAGRPRVGICQCRVPAAHINILYILCTDANDP
jgi:hypothetical protein